MNIVVCRRRNYQSCIKGCVVDIDVALGDRSAAITFGVGVTPGPLPFSSS